MREIIVAETAGFCFGVDRAVRMAETAAPCYTLGPLIHNRFAIENLARHGVLEIGSLDELPRGGTLIIRSHGAPKSLYDETVRRGITVIDATCPYVAKIHQTVKTQSGRKVMIFGDKNHPEVKATAGWCENPLIFASCGDIEQYYSQGLLHRDDALLVVSQTTAQLGHWETCVKFLKKLCTNVKKLDTICKATHARQREACLLSEKVDAVVVVGDPRSANTKGLAAVCRPPVLLIECAAGLDKAVLAAYRRIGVTAGASTPSAIIEEVVAKMSEEMKNTVEQDESFAEMLEQSFKTLNTGDKVTGVIASFSPTEIGVDLGIKQAAYIPLAEFTDDPDLKPEDVLKIGDEIETYVVRVNDVEGMVMLSKRRLDTVKSWEDVEAARENGSVVEGTVVEENKGGVVVSVKGVRVFIPASQTGLPKDTPLSNLLKKKVRLRVTEFHRARRRVVGSIRAVSQEERRAKAEQLWSTVEVGQKFDGTVKSVAAYGVFVDIGGVDGLVHMTELSWNRIKSCADFCKPGDAMAVVVVGVDKENKRISLSHRKTERNPWEDFVAQYNVGDTAEVKVVKLMPFGAFAEVMPGVDGLIHISQITDRRIAKPSDAIADGDTVTVKITDIDNERQKISLSVRALMEPEADSEEGTAEAGSDEIVAICDSEGSTIAEGIIEEE